MNRGVKPYIGLLALALILASCASGTCRQLRDPGLASQQDQPKGSPAIESPVVSRPGEAPPVPPLDAKEPTIFVSKADGSLQCQKGTGVSLDVMEKQLSGIRVFSREKRHDGLMHIQMCGHATGQLNVYEIPVTSLKEAESRGFKKL